MRTHQYLRNTLLTFVASVLPLASHLRGEVRDASVEFGSNIDTAMGKFAVFLPFFAVNTVKNKIHLRHLGSHALAI